MPTPFWRRTHVRYRSGPYHAPCVATEAEFTSSKPDDFAQAGLWCNTGCPYSISGASNGRRPGVAGDDEEPVPASFPSSQHRIRGRRTPARSGELPPDIEAAIWRGNQLGSPVTSVVASGFPALDAELPGAGWPCHSLTEILQPQPTVAEWRLLAPAMRQIVAGGGNIVVVGPPKSPHLPGLKYAGLDERHLVWIKAEAPAERLWVTEQLIKTNAAGLLVSWLPQARQE